MANARLTIRNPGSPTRQLEVSPRVLRVRRKAGNQQNLEVRNQYQSKIMVVFKNGTPLASDDHWFEVNGNATRTVNISNRSDLSLYEFSVIDRVDKARPVNDPVIIIDPN